MTVWAYFFVEREMGIMNKYVEDGIVISNECIGSNVWKMIVKAPLQAAEATVGTFAQLKVTGGTAPLLRRPISYANFDAKKGTVDFLYRVVGEGSKIMTTLKPGDKMDTLGPLGTSFKPTENMLLVGGGVGIAPMLAIASNLKENQRATVVLGFRDDSELFWADLFKDCPVDVYITTNDGSAGAKGFPTTIMPEILEKEEFTSVHTCGPDPMMRGVAKVATEHGVKCEVSLEARMGCGTGICYGCSMETTDGRRIKVCTHGPVFNSEEVFS